MWSEGEKVKAAVTNTMLARLTRLNFSSTEAESQNSELFPEQKEDKQE